MTLRRTLGWIAPLALALLAAASVMLVPATPAAAAGASPITVPFDHLTTGFELDGVHRDLPCESCHLNAVFRGTPRDCGTCHIKGSLFNATPKTQTHIPSTNKCAACHNTISFRPDMHFSHAEVMGSCVSCHNGTIATGMTIPPHPKTNQNCAACHTVISWNPPSMVDHTQIPLAVAGFCIICHNGKDASGKNPGHIATSLECGDCHLTTTWLGANFDHTGITTGCVSCHNGTKAVGKQGNHMPTSNLCEDCHTTGIGTKNPSWVPSKFDHTQMTVTTCETCHSGTVKISTGYVSGKPTNHVPVPTGPPNIDCGLCHGNNPSAETWTVIAASIATLHSGLNTATCLMCHGGETFAGVPAPYIPMSISGVSPTKKTPLAPPHIPVLTGTDCSACHNKAYQSGGFGPATAMSAKTHTFVSSTCDTCHETGKSFYVGSGTPLQLRPADHINSGDPRMVSGDCSVCHNTTDWTSTAMPTGHMPNPSNLSCLTCHTKSPSDYTPATLAANAVLHTGIKSNCGQCHGDNVTALTWANNYTPKDAILAPSHIPYLSGTDCSSCHASTTYAVGTFGPMNMTQAKHAFVPTSCDTCHEAGLTFYMGAATPALQGRPADHTSGQMVAPNDCGMCHTTANWNSTALPAGHMPNPANLACTVCHTSAPSVYTQPTLASNAVMHTGITGNCSQCHGATSPLTWFNNFTPKDAVLTPVHIPYVAGTDCSSCHSSATYAAGTFGPMNMNQAKHAFAATTCNTCHEAGLSFYMGAASPALQGRPADHTGALAAPADCSGCHTTANWNSSNLPAGHMPNPAALNCTVCHTSAPTNYKVFASNTVLHTGIAGNCSQCHGAGTQLTFYNNDMVVKDSVLTPAHIPYTSGTDCSSCHVSSTYAAGTFGPTNMTAALHAFVPTTCVTCHETGSNFYLGASTPAALQTRPADHIASGDAQQKSGDCSICHTPAGWASNTLPIGHMPNPGNQVCATCHIAITATFASYAVLTTNMAVMHTGIAGGCAQCHGAGSQLTFYNNNDNPKDAVLTPPHMPYLSGADCSSCHVVAATFGPTAMSAAKHAFVATACDSCHGQTTTTFYMGASTPTLQLRPANHTAGTQATGDCSGCHNTTDWTSQVMPTGHMPNPGAQTCSVCHIGAPTTYSTFATVAVLHTGISGNCALCHGNLTALSFYNNGDIPNEVPKYADSVAHIPYLNGADCSSCHTPPNYATGGFGPATAMSPAKHAFVPTTCDTCHDTNKGYYTGTGTALQLRPPTHISAPNPASQATGDCSLCHNTTDWTSPTTLPNNHMPIPGTATCSVCHTAIVAGNINSYATLASIPILHTGITNGCAQCHGGATQLTFYNNNDNPKAAASLSPPHIPAFNGEDCSSCHAPKYAIGGFGPMNMTQATHNGVGSTCNGCHEAGLSFYMGAASPGLQGRPADHTAGNQVAPNDCSGCHTTANWLTTTLPTGHMPNPGNQACNVCHTAAPANYATLAANSVLHTGITGNCIQCHGATQLTFYNNNDNPLPQHASHIPYLGGTDCGSCHKTTTYAAGTFGPMNMTQATHAFVTTTCDTCHASAAGSLYMGAASPALQLRPADHTTGTMLTGDCSACHTTANWNSTTLPAGHMPNPANQACNVCHTSTTDFTTATLAANSILHTGISGNCGQCHGAVAALTWAISFTPKYTGSLTPAHIPYTSGTDCSSCHSSATYAVGTFGPMNMTQAKHSFVPTTCNTCHEAGLSFYMGTANPALQGRPADHTAANQAAPHDCSGCHTTANWSSNSLPAGHMPNPANTACNTCHTGATATPANYALLAANSVMHTGITGNCIQCHGATQLTFYNNNDNPLPQHAGHIPYLVGTDCGSCHKTTTYAAGTFGPMNMTQATHAFVTTTCDTCHASAAGSLYMGAASPALQLRPADHNSGTMLTGDCSGCHTTANWNSTALPAGHMPNPGNLGCNTCHTAAPTNYATMAANSVMHTGITTNCSQCHGVTQLSFYNNNDPPKPQVAKHIPYLAGTDCGSCHKTTTYAAGAFGPMNMTQATHAFVTTTCDTCHASAAGSLYMGAASPALQLRPADHTSGTMLTGDCSGCHTTANWNSGSLPAGHMPNPGNQGCTVCHTAAPTNYATLAANAVLHTGITTGCITCHGAPNATPPVFYLNYTPKDAVLSPVHIPTAGTACESCHAVSFTTFSGTTMSAAKHTAMLAATGGTCDQCHDLSTLKFYGVTNLTTRPNGHHVGQDCKGCHSPNNWGGGAQKRTVAAAKTPANSTIGTVVTAAAARAAVPAAGPSGGDRGFRGGPIQSGVALGPIQSGVALGAVNHSVSHAGVTSNCASCHNGVLAAGKSAAHIASNNTCQNCHTTIAWLPARFDHQGVTAKCVSCHNGVVALGKPTLHVQTNQDCSACHGTITWTAVMFSHLGINAACQSCHNGITATGKQVQHVRTTLDCASCHNTLSWTVVSAPPKPSAPATPRPVTPIPRGATSGPTK